MADYRYITRPDLLPPHSTSINLVYFAMLLKKDPVISVENIL